MRRTSARRRRTLVRAAALAGVAAGLAAPGLRRRLRLPPPVVSVLTWQAPLALAVAFPPSHARAIGMYALQMSAYIVHYEMPADDPDAIQRRMKIDYPIAFDRAIGLGETPTTRLQRRFWREGRIAPHDAFLSALHWLWYFVPHGSILYVLAKRPERFTHAAGIVGATYDLGAVVYWVVPTAPPWWSGQNGHMPPVRRVMLDVGERAFGEVWKPLYDSFAGNPYAAMPSLHFATSVAAARALAEVGPRPAALGWAYAGGLGFALVYLGEHYVADLVGGFLLVEVARRVVRSPAFTGLERLVERISLEPA